MDIKKIKKHILLDLYRYYSGTSMKVFIKSYFLIPSFYYMCWFRIVENNCTISHNVTIGLIARGKNKRIPVLGDNCYIASGVNIIANNVAIGANAAVTTDIPDNAVVVGISAKVISFDGAKGYVNHEVLR